EEFFGLFGDGDGGRVNLSCRGEPVPSQEDEEEFLEGHLVDVLVQRYVRLDRTRLVLHLAVTDLDRDAESLERFVDLLVDVGLFLRRVLDPVPWLVGVSAGGATLEPRVGRIPPGRGVRVIVRLRLRPLGWACGD